ncbi:MAG: metallophosphoesterase [Planctomycetaceae bacterium]|jgi:serine/threonine protein phosphatase 1|nr:metallophosphoesterase [Planctomycetaceae bacterium]
MSGRTLAIGDIHGCLPALERLLQTLELEKDDTLVLLGDYVDRGPDTQGVIDRLLFLQEECRLYPILGNHDELILQIVDGETWKEGYWLSFGGQQTLDSYGVSSISDIPSEHLKFLRKCLNFCESEYHFFTHGNYIENKPLEKTPPNVLRWESLKTRMPGPHISKKVAVLGHSAQKETQDVLYTGYLICLDTYCYGNGVLTAFDVHTGEYWQTDKLGKNTVKKRLR